MSENTSLRFLTVAEVADMCRVSRMTVYRWVHNGDLPAVRFGKSFRVPQAAAEEFVERAAITSDLDQDGGSGVTAVG
ncbi:helix-turn-helix domain-containing protein [Demequina sp.]|uniref:helix-turn-helix domain-containing protein n=1 Tax=Demequina sp. TaxID=2050685 RepID=UPI0025C435DE|nr:helix-turn-helix domain-containing protein [Demequina sp.]